MIRNKTFIKIKKPHKEKETVTFCNSNTIVQKEKAKDVPDGLRY